MPESTEEAPATTLTRQISFRLSEEMFKTTHEWAVKEGRPEADVIRRALAAGYAQFKSQGHT